MATKTVWIVTWSSIRGNPVVGVFTTQGAATQHVDAAIELDPESVFDIAEYPVGVWNG